MSIPKTVLLLLTALLLLLCLEAASLNRAIAQAEQSDASETAEAGEQTERFSSDEAEPLPPDEITPGFAKGAYWWAEVDPVAIAAFADFGIDIAAIRLGRAGQGGMVSVQRSDVEVEVIGMNMGWIEGGDFDVLESLPSSLEYRLVIETQRDVWEPGMPGILVDWLGTWVIPAVVESGIPAGSIELKLPTGQEADPDVLETFLQELSAAEFDLPVKIGLNATYFRQISGAKLESLAGLVEGLVVYFMDYDYSEPSPRITDRAWIDGTSAELGRLGIPFVAVLPIYNRALGYPAESTEAGIVLGAIDLAVLGQSSEEHQMGAAGTEYVITEAIDIPGATVSVGDRIRILESLKEIDPAELITELPLMAPNCMEIDLFRFPLVPGFDPTASEALAAAGWLAVPVETEIDPEALEREELDSKHNQGQQIIWMITLGLMMVVLMRMFSKGAGKKQGGDAGGK